FKVRIYDEMDRLLGEGFNGDIIPLSRPVKPGERVNVRAYPIDESGKYIPHLYDPLKRFMEDEKSGTMAISFDQRLRPLIDVAREKNGLKLKFRDTAFYRKLKERISETEFKEKPPEFSEKSFGEYLEWSDCDGVKAIFGGENEGRKLYKHQDKALIELGSSGERKCIIVSSGMASGKTEIAVLYLLKAYKQHPDFGYAVVVYPTRELLRDQYARWRRYFESAYDLGYMYPVVEVAKYYGEVARGSKGQEELAKIKGGRCVILTTASTFCSQEFLSLLKRPPKVVVLDEVHFYRSFDLTLLMEFLRFATLRRGGFEKLMIFSATMGNADDFKRMVSHVLNVDGCLIHGEPIRGRKTIYIVDLSGLEEREQESLVDKVLEECSKRLDEKTIVFASNRTEAEGYYYHKLHKWGAKAALHIGDMSMAERKMAARKFRVGKCKWMVTVRTLEVGIDIGDVSRIVHLGLPPSMNEFMQREGRSGRQGQESESIIFARTKGELERAQTWVEEMRQGSSELLCRVTFNPQSLLAKKIREETSERWPNKINIKGVSVKCKVFGGLRFQLQLPPEFRGRDEVYTRDVIFRYLPYSIRRRRWKKLYVEKVEMKMMNSARRVILRHVEDNPEVRKLVESKAFYTTTSRVKTIIEPLSQPSGDMTTVKVRFRPLCVNYVGRSTRKISRIGGVTEVPQYFVMQRFDVADEVAWRLERLSEDFTRGFIISIEIPKDILRELIMGIAEGEEDTEKILSEIQW
ncbi:MAG: helicase-related protein, partial [Candidatus Bathyarchaeales archaeon]